ncbi:MAG: hypothetical protein U9O18_09940 [Chloroflexota bacterium]|nr:hypothetical protein [Chloroflexota bacterium]
MAARLTGLRRLVLAAAVALLAVSACTSLDRPTIQADKVSLPTPMQSYGASVAAVIDQLQDAVRTAGARLEVPTAAYRPSEPESLLQAPRVVMRADLADTGDGYVVIYQTADRGAAEQRGQELAGYLGSGFGQTNFAADTQFSVGVLDDTVIFTSWSRRRSDDSERAEAVFDAIAGVGEPVKVNK